MRTFFHRAIAALLVALPLAGCGGGGSMAPPDLIALPNGFQPEGIASQGNFLYVGSIPTGAVYRADLITGVGGTLVPSQAGRAAIGLKVDGRGRLFVAGGATGKAFVYDAASGQDLAGYTLTQATTTFVNDVVLTADAAWFTESRNPVLYRVAIAADGSLGGQEAVSTLTLSGDLAFQAGVTNLNGIVATATKLIVVQSNTGFLFTVDPISGVTKRIDLGAEIMTNGDGLLLEGQTLFVVQNRLNQVAVIDLAPDLASGTVRTRLTNPAFDVPTTMTAAGKSLYAVNARFGVQVTADTTYSVVRFDRP
jgi:hypothetical protein